MLLLDSLFPLLQSSANIAHCIYGSSGRDCVQEGVRLALLQPVCKFILDYAIKWQAHVGLRYLPGATEEEGKRQENAPGSPPSLYLLSLSRLSTSNCSPYKRCFSLSHLIVAARAVDETQEVITICASN